MYLLEICIYKILINDIIIINLNTKKKLSFFMSKWQAFIMQKRQKKSRNHSIILRKYILCNNDTCSYNFGMLILRNASIHVRISKSKCNH